MEHFDSNSCQSCQMLKRGWDSVSQQFGYLSEDQYLRVMHIADTTANCVPRSVIINLNVYADSSCSRMHVRAWTPIKHRMVRWLSKRSEKSGALVVQFEACTSTAHALHRHKALAINERKGALFTFLHIGWLHAGTYYQRRKRCKCRGSRLIHEDVSECW